MQQQDLQAMKNTQHLAELERQEKMMVDHLNKSRMSLDAQENQNPNIMPRDMNSPNRPKTPVRGPEAKKAPIEIFKKNGRPTAGNTPQN